MNIHAIPTLIASLYSIILGSFVILKNKRSYPNLAFFVFLLSTFFWQGGTALTLLSKEPAMALLCTRLAFFGIALIPVTTYHFVASFLKIEHKKIVSIGYLISLLFFFPLVWTSYIFDGVYEYSWGYWYKAGSVHPFFLGYFIFFMLLSFYKLYVQYKKEDVPIERNRKKYLFFGLMIAYIGSVDYIPTYGITFYPFGWLPFMIFLSMAFYAIVRYRLMDINFVFKKTMAYSLSAGLLTGLFVVLILTATQLFSTFAHVDSFKISVVAALAIALLFNPIRIKIQTLIDKLFYKKTYDYYATVRKVSHELASIFYLKKVYDFIGDAVFSTLGLRNIYLLTAVPYESYKVVYHTSYAGTEGKKGGLPVKGRDNGTEENTMIDDDSAVVRLLNATKDIIIKDELPAVEKTIGYKGIERIKDNLKPFKGEAVVPVFVDAKLMLLMILGEKLSGDVFTNEDINLLNTISNQTAIAIKNTQLYAEKVRSERLASIGMMSATFAHEIKNPLTSIKTFAQLITEKFSDVDFRENFSKIVIKSVQQIDGLITDLLDYSSDRMFIGMNSLNITEVVDRTIDEVKTTLAFENKNINIEKKYKDVKIDVLGDENKLRQAFINIITNSCQAIPKSCNDGTLSVTINPNRENVNISITDNGEGISLEDIPKMFEPFFSTKTLGVGLGLAITKKIIETHGGKIAVASKLKEGTTFTVTLPVKN